MKVHQFRKESRAAKMLICARNTNTRRKEQVMKKIAGKVIFGLAAAIMLLVVGCSMDSAELGEYVKKEMQEELVKNDVFKSLQMKSVRLIKGEGVEYAGVGKGEIDGYPVKFDVKCKYDGKTVLWDASLVDDNMLTLAGVAAGKAVREKAADLYNRIKEAWPGVKTNIKQKYDAASKKAGEYYNAATKKVEEGIDSVKESIQGEPLPREKAP